MTKSFSISAADKTSIPALHFDRGGNRLVVASHGITAEKTEDGLYNKFIESLPAHYDALLFDFRGHGDSKLRSDRVTIAGELLDLMAAFNWARQKGYSSIDHVATSFGASISLLAAGSYGLDFLRKVVFWNPVINYRNTFIESTVEWAHEFFNQVDIFELSARQFTKIPETTFKISAQMTQELLILHPEMVRWPSTTPLLILHGDSDTLVPVEDSRRYARANNAKITTFPGADHGFDEHTSEAIRLTVSWFEDEQLS